MTKKILSSILVCSLILSGLPYALAWNNDYSSDSYSDSYYQKWDDYKYNNQQNSWRQNYDQNLNNNWNPPTVKTPATNQQVYIGESRPGGDIQVAQTIQPNVEIFKPQLSPIQESQAVTTNPQIYSEESRFSGKVETVDPSAALEANQLDINKFSSVNTESLSSNSFNTPIRSQAVDNQARAGMSDEAFISQAKSTVPAVLPDNDKPIQQKVYLDNSPDYKFTGQTHTPIVPGAGVIYQIYEYANKQTGETKIVDIHPADAPMLAQVEAKIKEQSQNLEGQVKAITPLVVKQGRSSVIPAGPKAAEPMTRRNNSIVVNPAAQVLGTGVDALAKGGQTGSGWISYASGFYGDQLGKWTESHVKNKQTQTSIGFGYGLIEGLANGVGGDMLCGSLQLPKLANDLIANPQATVKALCQALGISYNEFKTKLDKVMSGTLNCYEAGRAIGNTLGRALGWEAGAKLMAKGATAIAQTRPATMSGKIAGAEKTVVKETVSIVKPSGPPKSNIKPYQEGAYVVGGRKLDMMVKELAAKNPDGFLTGRQLADVQKWEVKIGSQGKSVQLSPESEKIIEKTISTKIPQLIDARTDILMSEGGRDPGWHVGKHGVGENVGEVFFNDPDRYIVKSMTPQEAKQSMYQGLYGVHEGKVVDIKQFTNDAAALFNKFKQVDTSTIWEGQYIALRGLSKPQINVDFVYNGDKWRIAVDKETGQLLNFFKIDENKITMWFANVKVIQAGNATNLLYWDSRAILGGS